MFVAVIGVYGKPREVDAEEIAKNFLFERSWFSDPEADNDADYIL